MHKQLFAFIGNDSNIHFQHVHHSLSLTLVRSATVAFTLVESGTLTQVTGQTWPSSMTLTNSETAHWIGPLVNSLVLAQSQFYQANVTFDIPGGIRQSWRVPIQAIYRES